MIYYRINNINGLCVYKFKTLKNLQMKNSCLVKINCKEYENLPQEELTFTSHNVSQYNWSIAQTIKYFYSYYYLQSLYYQIKNCNFGWKWSTVQDFKTFALPVEKIKNDLISHPNPFVNNHYPLAQDIMENGMFFPFTYHCGNKILRGSHRLFALQQAAVDKEFLFLNTENLNCTWRWNNYNDLKIKSLEPIFNAVPFFFFSEDFTTIYKTTATSKGMINFWGVVMDDSLAPKFFNYRDEIKPLNLFNNKQDFGDFIHQPFPHILELDDFN